MPAHDASVIRSFLPVSDTLCTSGQPTREQFALIRAAGYQVVINLAMPDSTDALPDEGEIVAGLGMDYIHIPVVWLSPTAADLERFFEVMERNQGKRVWLHCVVNMRVSVFVFLYRIIRQGAPLAAARETMLHIWEPNEVWQRFIESSLVAGGL